MATKLTKPVVRETLSLDPIKLERIIAKLDMLGVMLRQKGRRREFFISYADLFRIMFQQEADAARVKKIAEKKEKAKQRKLSR